MFSIKYEIGGVLRSSSHPGKEILRLTSLLLALLVTGLFPMSRMSCLILLSTSASLLTAGSTAGLPTTDAMTLRSTIHPQRLTSSQMPYVAILSRPTLSVNAQFNSSLCHTLDIGNRWAWTGMSSITHTSLIRGGVTTGSSVVLELPWPLSIAGVFFQTPSGRTTVIDGTESRWASWGSGSSLYRFVCSSCLSA